MCDDFKLGQRMSQCGMSLKYEHAAARSTTSSCHENLLQQTIRCGVCMCLSRSPVYKTQKQNLAASLTMECTGLLKSASMFDRLRLHPSPCRSARALVHRVTPMPTFQPTFTMQDVAYIGWRALQLKQMCYIKASCCRKPQTQHPNVEADNCQEQRMMLAA